MCLYLIGTQNVVALTHFETIFNTWATGQLDLSEVFTHLSTTDYENYVVFRGVIFTRSTYMCYIELKT